MFWSSGRLTGWKLRPLAATATLLSAPRPEANGVLILTANFISSYELGCWWNSLSLFWEPSCCSFFSFSVTAFQLDLKLVLFALAADFTSR